MVKIYLTSDTHFNHKTMIEKQWRNFKTVEDMNNTIIKNWNSVVSDDDIVYHLGDVYIGKSKEFVENILPFLNGNIIYIKGNHDKKSFTHIQSMIITFLGKTFELIHNPSHCTFSTDYILHGHIHKSGKGFKTDEPNRFYNVNLEFHNYRPKLLNEILGELKTNCRK